MISPQILRDTARDWHLKVDTVEKHYVLGWILYGISTSSIGKSLTFKGGTSLSKVYFPSDWRLSEDLDFTLLDETTWDIIVESLEKEIPSLAQKVINIPISLHKKPLTNPGFLRGKIKYVGPISSGTVKVEIRKEEFIGNLLTKDVPKEFDYIDFSTSVYALETIVGEKMRAILERGYIRDYYDVWRLLKEQKFNLKEARQMFVNKCQAKNVKFSSIDQFFPDKIEDTLSKHLDNLERLSREPLPTIKNILDELRKSLEKFL